MPWLFDANHLNRWADDRSAQDFLPRLVRQLIHGLTDDLQRIVFPAGSSVQLGGWDGIVESPGGNEFVPPGVSGWELSTHKGKKKKADRDYKKRSENPGNLDPSESTFVFVTARRWAGKGDWEAARKKEGVWRDVRALDAEDLAAWLERTPPVAAWFAVQLDLPIDSVQALVDFLSTLKETTEPALSADLLLAGRDDQGKTVSQWLERESGVYRIQAESEEEAIAFLAATVEKLPAKQQERWLSRAIVLDKPEAWRGLGGRRSGLLVVLRGPYEQEASAIQRDRNHVLLASATRSRLGQPDQSLELKRIPHEAFKDALKEMGLVDHKARKLAHETGRSLSVLRRRLMPVPPEPPWAKPENAAELLPALLAGSWDEEREGDKEILSLLADQPYEDFTKPLRVLAEGPEPPIRRVATVWSLTAPMDAFLALGGHLRPSDLDRFEKAVKTVLLEVDPALDLPVEDRWAANLQGKQRRQSNWLRCGLAETIALLPIVDTRTKLNLGFRVGGRLHGLVRGLFESADGARWYSLSGHLPTLAEAAPEAFLEAVEDSLQEDDPAVSTLFVEEEGLLFSSANHSELLWALEKISWTPEYLTQAALILARLAELDPGGTYANRPANSLREIFLPWFRNTSASFNQRIQALDSLLERHPQVAAPLLLSLLPQEHDTSMHTIRPRWRDWDSGADEPVLQRDYWAFIGSVRERLLAWTPNHPEWWPQIVAEIASFDEDGRAAIRQGLRTLEVQKLEGEVLDALGKNLREMVTRHRQYQHADWALPSQEIDELEEIRDHLPLDLDSRFGWLFDSYWVALPEADEGASYEERIEAANRERESVARQILLDGGIESLLTFASIVEDPQLVGVAAVSALQEDGNAERQFLAATLGSEESSLRWVALGYVQARRQADGGEEWADQELARSRREDWQPAATADLFCGLPHSKELWDKLDAYSDAVKDAYWRKVTNFRKSPLAAVAIEKFIEVGRRGHALSVSSVNVEDVPSDLHARVLEEIAMEGPEDAANQPGWYVYKNVFEVLQQRGDLDRQRLARLEFLYLDLLIDAGTSCPPRTIFDLLSEDPKFFAEIVSWIYPGKGEKKPSSRDQSGEALVGKGFRLLNSWDGLPGLSDDGLVDSEALVKWVTDARGFCESSGRGDVGDQEIGRVLSRAPMGSDGLWPAEPVRELLEQLQNCDVESGFDVGVMNARGVVWRGPGGDQERELEGKYRGYAEALASRWPRTARVLREIADSYASQGTHWDREDELDYLR